MGRCTLLAGSLAAQVVNVHRATRYDRRVHLAGHDLAHVLDAITN